jgi:hypothetical protein
MAEGENRVRGGVRRSAYAQTQGQSGYENVLSTAKDVQRFVQLFAGMILHSTPHLYASALPFSPLKTTIARKFTARFPNTLVL